MDTHYSTFKKNKTVYTNTFRILAILAVGFLAAGSALAQDESPWFTVFPEQGVVEGWQWPLDTVIHMTIDNPGTEVSPDFEKEGTMVLTPWDPDSGATWLWIDFIDEYSIKPGDIVTLTDGVTKKTHVVQNLSTTAINPDENTVTGIADGGQSVILWSWEGGSSLETTADESGYWSADFDDVGFDLMPGYHVRAEVWDEDGDDTAVDWSIPNPRFVVFPEWEFFDGLDWPNGAKVSITVEDKPECSLERESWNYFFNGNFPEGCDIQADDTITFDDGTTTREHIVQNLEIAKVNQEDNIIKGFADAGAEVHVWPHATGQEQLAITNPQGKWNVDFTGLYDLMTGDAGRAEIRDEFGNATAADWFVSQPRFTIFPDAQWFDGIDWPDGATVTITVKDKPECSFTRESWGGFFNGGFPEDCMIAVRDRVTFTDGKIIRKHTVQNLAISRVDKETNIVYGYATPGTVIHTWVWDMEGSNLEVMAVDGLWQADFGALEIDLEVGMGIQAEIRDEKGNATSVDLPVPDPRMVASLSENWVYLVDFIPGSMLNLTIYENQSSSPDWQVTRTADVNGFAWIDSEGWEIDPGDYLIATDGTTTKTLEVEGFTFDLFDLTNGHLEGTAPEPNGRDVWAGFGYEDGGWSQVVTTDETGAWLADFGGPIPTDYWWVWAQIFDDDGDASELRPARIIGSDD